MCPLVVCFGPKKSKKWDISCYLAGRQHTCHAWKEVSSYFIFLHVGLNNTDKFFANSSGACFYIGHQQRCLPCTDLRWVAKCWKVAAGLYFKLHADPQIIKIISYVTVTHKSTLIWCSVNILNCSFSELEDMDFSPLMFHACLSLQSMFHCLFYSLTRSALVLCLMKIWHKRYIQLLNTTRCVQPFWSQVFQRTERTFEMSQLIKASHKVTSFVRLYASHMVSFL